MLKRFLVLSAIVSITCAPSTRAASPAATCTAKPDIAPRPGYLEKISLHFDDYYDVDTPPELAALEFLGESVLTTNWIRDLPPSYFEFMLSAHNKAYQRILSDARANDVIVAKLRGNSKNCCIAYYYRDLTGERPDRFSLTCNVKTSPEMAIKQTHSAEPHFIKKMGGGTLSKALFACLDRLSAKYRAWLYDQTKAPTLASKTDHSKTLDDLHMLMLKSIIDDATTTPD
jgi:hypothetical protein